MPFNWFMERETKKEKKDKAVKIQNSGKAPKERKSPEVQPPVPSEAAAINPQPAPDADALLMNHMHMNQEAFLQALGTQKYQPSNPSALLESERKMSPRNRPPLANAPVSDAFNNPPADAENLLLNYMVAQHNNGQDLMAPAMSNANQAAYFQGLGGDITDRGFLAGVAAATQCHNARMESIMGGTMHPQASLLNSAPPAMMPMLTLNQGNNYSNILGIENPTQEELVLQAALLQALQINADLTNALSSLTSQPAQSPSLATMQREVQANERLQAFQQHQGSPRNFENYITLMAELQAARDGTSIGCPQANQQGSPNSNGLDFNNMTAGQLFALLNKPEKNAGNL